MAQFAYRELYCPAHFGNSYEVMWPGEMKELLSECRFWGFNVYGDWFDCADLKSPCNNPRGEFLLPQAIWERKLRHFQVAGQLGFRTDLCITPNHVFMDQLEAGLLADTADRRFFGQLLCPSKPRAREVILGNYRRLFDDLREQGVQLDSISGCPFDYGGCGCSACAPWIITFGRLMVDIHEEARRRFPDVEARLIGWWWTGQEHQAFKQWADSAENGRFVSLALHIPYGATMPDPSRALPERCARHAFVHIGYGDLAKPDDLYGPWGPVMAPVRIPDTLNGLAALGIEGYMAYSEGLFDDVNKALLGGLSSGRFASAAEVLAAYAERYLGATGADIQRWAGWMVRWGRPFEVNAKGAGSELADLRRRAKPGWRLAQLEAKQALFEAHADVLSRPAWDEARLSAAERFFAARERLERGIWGLGLVRHVLNDRYRQPVWFADWQSHQDRSSGDSGTTPHPDA
jgi:hypothetical protein